MRIMFALIACLMIASPAIARPLTIQAPSAYESGENLPLSDIQRFTIYCNGAQVTTAQPSGQATEVRVVLSPGNYTCYATATARDLESGESNSVNFTVDPSRPLPPVLVINAG
jgi:hypothetical protein